MNRLSATSVYYAGEFWLAVAWTSTFTVTAVYFVRDVGMNPFQLVLVGTVMELAIFLCEIPTGVVADTYGRRLSMVIGFLVMGAGMVLVGAVAAVGTVLAGYAIWGIGYTFTSGAQQAWISDEVGVDRVGRVFARGQQVGYLGGFLGIGLGVGVGSYDLGLAVALGGAMAAAYGLFAFLFMPETGFVRPGPSAGSPRRSAVVSLRTTAGAAAGYVRAQPLLLLLLGIAFFAGASTESYDRLWEAHLIRDVGLPGIGSLDPVVWFGIFGAVSMVLGLIASQVLVMRFQRHGQERLARLLLLTTVVQVGAVLLFAFSGSLVAAAAGMWLYGLTRSVSAPVSLTWLNEQIGDSRVRATVISITNQSDALGQVTGGPAVGALGSLVSLRAALVAGAALLAPAIGLYVRAVRHGGSEPELRELSDSPGPAAG